MLYTFTDYSLLVQADYKKGCKGASVVEELKRDGHLPVFVRISSASANMELHNMGALAKYRKQA